MANYPQIISVVTPSYLEQCDTVFSCGTDFVFGIYPKKKDSFAMLARL